MVIKFFLGVAMIVSVVWLIAAPDFLPAMMLAVSFTGLAAALSSPTEIPEMRL
ncbi:MAG: hypothetical protein RLY71_3602 [Pseudomonadota bacterium]|jgi:hypothetical protein